MGTLEELLTEHGIRFDRRVLERGRLDILRLYRHYTNDLPPARALRLAYVDVSTNCPKVSQAWN